MPLKESPIVSKTRLTPEPVMVPVVFKGGGRAKVTELVAKVHFLRGEAEEDKDARRQDAQSGR